MSYLFSHCLWPPRSSLNVHKYAACPLPTQLCCIDSSSDSSCSNLTVNPPLAFQWSVLAYNTPHKWYKEGCRPGWSPFDCSARLHACFNSTAAWASAHSLGRNFWPEMNFCYFTLLLSPEHIPLDWGLETEMRSPVWVSINKENRVTVISIKVHHWDSFLIYEN